MNFLQNFYGKRKVQLEIEEKNDKVLETCVNGKEFVFALRDLNRTLSRNLYNSSLYDAVSISEKNIQIMDSVYPENFSCEKIPELLEKIRNYNNRN